MIAHTTRNTSVTCLPVLLIICIATYPKRMFSVRFENRDRRVVGISHPHIDSSEGFHRHILEARGDRRGVAVVPHYLPVRQHRRLRFSVHVDVTYEWRHV